MSADRKLVTTLLGRQVTVPGPWTSFEEAAAANRAAGKHFFDDDKSLPVNRLVHFGRFVICPSEAFDGSVYYRVDAVLDDGRIDILFDSSKPEHHFTSVADAKAALHDLVIDAPTITAELAKPAPARPTLSDDSPAPSLAAGDDSADLRIGT